MTETELQELSRRAAGCLPEHATDISYDDGTIHAIDGRFWLHESTEACCEIMVRVLWADNVDITGGMTLKGTWGAGWSGIKDGEFVYDDDPMLAFRVAVLRALVALKGKS